MWPESDVINIHMALGRKKGGLSLKYCKIKIVYDSIAHFSKEHSESIRALPLRPWRQGGGGVGEEGRGDGWLFLVALTCCETAVAHNTSFRVERVFPMEEREGMVVLVLLRSQRDSPLFSSDV